MYAGGPRKVLLQGCNPGEERVIMGGGTMLMGPERQNCRGHALGDSPGWVKPGMSQLLSPDSLGHDLTNPVAYSVSGEVDPDVLKALRKYDHNNDGRINASEVSSMAKDLLQHKNLSTVYRRIAIVMIIFTAVLLAGVFGMTFAVVKILQDTQLQPSSSGPVMVDKISKGVIQVS